MSRDRVVGGVLLAGGIAGILVYAYLLILYPIILLQITAFIAVAAILGILAWIGWTMATTPSVEPMTPPETSSPSQNPESPQGEKKE
ncbi:MAG: transcriptional regulator [Thaumarchaeota archaeon]|nr:transcriptional regulator [Nitrososphaerota archaeon]